MATESISKAYFTNPSHQSVYPSYRCKATARLSVSLLSVLSTSSVNKFRLQKYTRDNRGIVGCVILYVVHVLSKKSACVCVSTPIVARRQHGKDVPRQLSIVGDVVFYVVRVVSKEHKRLVLPRTSCYTF
jgi:hypothetical protein